MGGRARPERRPHAAGRQSAGAAAGARALTQPARGVDVDRRHDFHWLWGAETVSTAGSLLTRMALPLVAILALGATPGQMAGLRGAELAAGFAVSLVAGAWLESRRKRPVMMATDVARAALLGTLALLAATGRLQFGSLLVLGCAAAALGALFDIAWQAHLPRIVERTELVRSQSRIHATNAAVEVTSFGAAGWLVQVAGGPLALAIDACTFVASALCVGRLRTAEPPVASAERPRGARAFFADAQAGLTAAWSDPIQRALLATTTCVDCAGGVFAVLYVLFATRDLGMSATTIGLVAAVGGLSSFAGAWLAPGLAVRVGPGRAIGCGLASVTVGMLLVAFAPGPGLTAVAMLVGQQIVGDVGWSIFMLHGSSVRLARAPEGLRARISAAAQVASFGGRLAGTIAAGIVAERVGARAGIALGPLVLALATAVAWTSRLARVRHVSESVAG